MSSRRFPSVSSLNPFRRRERSAQDDPKQSMLRRGAGAAATRAMAIAHNASSGLSNLKGTLMSIHIEDEMRGSIGSTMMKVGFLAFSMWIFGAVFGKYDGYQQASLIIMSIGVGIYLIGLALRYTYDASWKQEQIRKVGAIRTGAGKRFDSLRKRFRRRNEEDEQSSSSYFPEPAPEEGLTNLDEPLLAGEEDRERRTGPERRQIPPLRSGGRFIV